MINVFSLADVADSYRVTMDISIDNAFYAHASKGITRYGWTVDRMCAAKGHASNNVSRSEWEAMFKMEGNVNANKI